MYFNYIDTYIMKTLVAIKYLEQSCHPKKQGIHKFLKWNHSFPVGPRQLESMRIDITNFWLILEPQFILGAVSL